MRIYKRPGSDIYQSRVRNAAGRIVRRSTGCRDYKAAEAVAREFEREAVDPDYAASKATRLDASVKNYFDELTRRKSSAATLEIAATKCGHLVRIWGHEKLLIEITPKVVLAYVDQREGEGASKSTVSKELKALRGVLTVAKHLRLWSGDIATTLPLRYGSGYKPRERFLTPVEFDALLANLGPDRASHVAFFVATGSRLGEAQRARRGDIHFDRGTVSIRGTKTDAAEAEVPITRITEPVLRYALEHAPGGDADDDVLFLPWGNYLRDIKAACVRAGIGKCSPNDLRRTFGKWHRMAGIEPSVLAPMLRHTTDKLAQTTYAKVSGAEVRLLVEATLDALALPTSSVEADETKPTAAHGTVSDLCHRSDTDEINATERDDADDENTAENEENMGTPGPIRTGDHRLRRPSVEDCSSRREKGNKLAWGRRQNALTVSNLNVDKPAKSARSSAGDEPPSLVRLPRSVALRGFHAAAAAWFRRAA